MNSMAREERNNDLLKYLQYKLVKQNNKIEKITDWFNDKDEIGETVGETLTLGTEENLKTIAATSVIPAAGVAIGIASAFIGAMVVLPTAFDPVNEKEIEAFKELTTVGEQIFNFSTSSFAIGVKSALIPLGITTISIPKKIFRYVTDKINEKTEPITVENQKIVELIDDFTNNKDDQSLAFFKTFAKRVDLKDNSDEFNLELLKHFAYFRSCVQAFEKKEIDEHEVMRSFLSIIHFLQDTIDSKKVADSFKNNRFLKLLIEDYDVMQENYDKCIKK